MAPSWYERATRLQQSLFDKELVAFPPNVTFRGEICRSDGSELSDHDVDLLKWIVSPVAQATREIVLPDAERFKVTSHSVSPKTIIHISGVPNASATDFKEGQLHIYLGLLFAFWSLRGTYGLINGMTKRAGITASELDAFEPPDEVITELDRLMNAWYMSSQSEWQRIFLPQSLTSAKNDHLGMDRGMAYIVTGHELTHWFKTIYKESEWERMMTEVSGHVGTWLSEESMTLSDAAMEQSRSLLQDDAVHESWLHEIHADAGAFDYFLATETHGGWQRSLETLMRAYVHMAFFFSLHALIEVFHRATGQPLDPRSHPPSLVRRALWCHIQAKRSGMSQQDFMFRQFGAGTITCHIMDAVIQRYIDILDSRATNS